MCNFGEVSLRKKPSVCPVLPGCLLPEPAGGALQGPSTCELRPLLADLMAL